MHNKYYFLTWEVISQPGLLLEIHEEILLNRSHLVSLFHDDDCMNFLLLSSLSFPILSDFFSNEHISLV